MGKLKERFKFDLKDGYTQMNLYPNSLCLNKKMYLLYNFWNKKREFFLLKNDSKESRYPFNFIGFSSLMFFNLYKTVKFDYFNKWSSSFTQLNGANMRNMISLNIERKFIDCSWSLDYTIFDDIFINYVLNKRSSFYFFNKSKAILDILFKLSKKKESLKFKDCTHINFFYDFIPFNENYNNKLYVYNWKRKFVQEYFYNNIKLYIRFFYLKDLKKKINLYFIKKKSSKFFFLSRKNTNLFFSHFNKEKINIYIYSKSFLNNKIFFLKNYILFRKFFQHLYFIKKINRRLFGYKLRLKKFLGLRFFKKRFLPILGHSVYKNFKKKNFFFFLKKQNNKNFFSRQFIGFQNLKYDQTFLKKKILKFPKKRKIRFNLRYIKKLKTFYYIPNPERTREQVYKRFKKSVVNKFKRRKLRKPLKYFTGLRFNLSYHNARNRYRNRMRAKILGKKSTPLFHFFKKRKNFYKKGRKYRIDKKYNELSYKTLKRYRFNISRKKREFLDTEDWKVFKVFRKIRNKPFVKTKKIWLYLYKNRGNKLKKVKFFKYVNYLMSILQKNHLKRRKKKLKILKLYNERINKKGKRGKKAFWFFQRILLYFKNTIQLKKGGIKSFDIYYIKNFSSSFLGIIYKNFFYLNLKFIKLFLLNKFLNLNKKKKKVLWFYLSSIIMLFKLYYIFFIFFVRNMNKLHKIDKQYRKTKGYKKFKKIKEKIKKKLKRRKRKKKGGELNGLFLFLKKRYRFLRRKRILKYLKKKYLKSNYLKKKYLKLRILRLTKNVKLKKNDFNLKKNKIYNNKFFKKKKFNGPRKNLL